MYQSINRSSCTITTSNDSDDWLKFPFRTMCTYTCALPKNVVHKTLGFTCRKYFMNFHSIFFHLNFRSKNVDDHLQIYSRLLHQPQGIDMITTESIYLLLQCFQYFILQFTSDTTHAHWVVSYQFFYYHKCDSIQTVIR